MISNSSVSFANVKRPSPSSPRSCEALPTPNPSRSQAGRGWKEESAAQLLNRIDKLTQEQGASRGTLRRLQAQRDGAHEQIKKLEQSLADARQEAATLRASGVTAPPDDPRRTQPARPEPPSGRVSTGAEVSAAGEEQKDEKVAEQSAGQPAASSDRPTLDAVVTQRATVPPAPNELAAALVESPTISASGHAESNLAGDPAPWPRTGAGWDPIQAPTSQAQARSCPAAPRRLFGQR